MIYLVFLVLLLSRQCLMLMKPVKVAAIFDHDSDMRHDLMFVNAIKVSKDMCDQSYVINLECQQITWPPAWDNTGAFDSEDSSRQLIHSRKGNLSRFWKILSGEHQQILLQKTLKL